MRQLNLKEKLLKELNLCVAIADDILQNDKSREVKMYAKNFAEIWDPLDDGKEGYLLQIRIHYGDVYIYLYDDGSKVFQVDPIGAGFGTELIDGCSSKEDLMKAILNLEEAPIIRDGCVLYDAEDGYTDNIPMYIPYNPDNLVQTFPSQLNVDEYENSPQEMAEKLMEFIRDFSDNEEELKGETKYVAELFSKLQKSNEFNILAHHLDILFMDEIFSK